MPACWIKSEERDVALGGTSDMDWEVELAEKLARIDEEYSPWDKSVGCLKMETGL